MILREPSESCSETNHQSGLIKKELIAINLKNSMFTSNINHPVVVTARQQLV